MVQQMFSSKLFSQYRVSTLLRFQTYHKENPQVYQQFKVLAEKMLNTGRSRYSSKTIMEQVRWHTDISTRGDAFKVNNSYTALYVRMLILENSEFAGFFSIRFPQSSAA